MSDNETPVDLMRVRSAAIFLQVAGRVAAPELPAVPRSRLLTRVALVMAQRAKRTDAGDVGR